MLYHIHIKNFAIIDDLELDLSSGMTVLTGETGAGKSIVIDAIEIALGQRINNEVIRLGSERAEINLSFDINTIPAAQQWLQEHELDAGNECLIRRTISHDGRSKSFINNTPITLPPLRELGTLLINIHGQHEFQTLVKPNEQRYLVDQYGKLLDFTNTLNSTYRTWQEKQIKYQQLLTNSDQAKQRADYLAFQLQELDELNLTIEELPQLEQEHQQLSHAETLINNCQATLELLNEQEHSILNQLNQCSHQLNHIQQLSPQLNEALQLITNAIIQSEEASNEIQQFLNRTDLNPKRLQQIEQRLTQTYDLARKHRIEPKELPALQQGMAHELEKLTHHDDYLAQLRAELEQLTTVYQQQAVQLTTKRQHAAIALSKKITTNMQQLGMPNGHFAVELEPKEITQPQLNGMEKINFLVSVNPGQSLQALNKIASGGELSRISLAIQVITTQQNNTPTLIFDEIDVGIGGATADIVGKQLRQLARHAQVFCVTHLAQVAAKGQHHLQVQKSVQHGNTISTLLTLDEAARINELARMTGGSKITQQALAHAKEMLANID